MPKYKVRVCGQGWVLWLASSIEPVIRFDAEGRLTEPDWALIVGTEDGDTLGFINWGAVVAVSWRRAATGRWIGGHDGF